MAQQIANARIEVRALSESSRTFDGYGSRFEVVDSYGDVIKKGAFARTLQDRKGKILMLWQHDPARPIGAWTELREDDRGLWVKGHVVDDQAYALLKAGALDGLSVGFRTIKSRLDSATGLRTLTDVELMEISVVSFPANDDRTHRERAGTGLCYGG